jgi:hypothetical protein
MISGMIRHDKGIVLSHLETIYTHRDVSHYGVVAVDKICPMCPGTRYIPTERQNVPTLFRTQPQHQVISTLVL